MSRAARTAHAKAALRAHGYSAPVAAAVADALDGAPDLEHRKAVLLTAAGASGITDGAPRGYFVRVLAHALKWAPYPSAPANVPSPSFVEQRARDHAAHLAA